MAAILREARQQQMDEFECVLSMFPDPQELAYDAALKRQYDQSLLQSNVTEDLALFEFTIRFVHLEIDGIVPELGVVYPRAYPLSCSIEFVVRCASLTRSSMGTLQKELLDLATGTNGEPVVLQLYQCMADRLHDAITEKSQAAIQETVMSVPAKTEAAPTLLGRRAIYFHHIIASTKRRVVKEWARELSLGGFSKIGWPGVVVVEGDERNVQAYVRRLQHLRWKQMTVRGEQTEPIATKSVDAQRKLPRAFCEFPETAMADAAALCRDAGVEPLFLSVMKIYRTEEDTEETEDKKKKKQHR